MTSALIVRLGALGDVVHAMPVVAALRERWPSARIDWLVDPRYADAVALVNGVTRVIPFDPRGLMVAGDRARTLAALADLRRAHYDVVFDLQGLVKSAVAARLAGGAETVGFGKAQLREPAARFFYTRTVDTEAAQHVIAKNLSLLSAVDVTSSDVRFALTLPPRPGIEHLAGEQGGGGYAAMNPGAAWPNKRWPAARFGELAALLRERSDLSTIVTWGPGEESLARGVVASSAGAARLAPVTDVVDLFALFRHARLAIAGDTGPLHMAMAVDTPVVGLFGPTSVERNGPWRPDDASVSRAGQCQCHYERRCRLKTPCIEDISVADVMSAAEAVLTRTAGRRRG